MRKYKGKVYSKYLVDVFLAKVVESIPCYKIITSLEGRRGLREKG